MKAVRAWIGDLRQAQVAPSPPRGGEKPRGLALRIVPSRGVDEGWTVRLTPSKDKLPELEITTYEEKK